MSTLQTLHIGPKGIWKNLLQFIFFWWWFCSQVSAPWDSWHCHHPCPWHLMSTECSASPGPCLYIWINCHSRIWTLTAATNCQVWRPSVTAQCSDWTGHSSAPIDVFFNYHLPAFGILIMVKQVRLMMFSLNSEHTGLFHVLPLTVHLKFFFNEQEGVSFTLWGFWWDPSFLLKRLQFVVGWTGLVWALRVWGQGLTIKNFLQNPS